MLPDFVAIDFETATRDLCSACAVGIAVVKDLEIVDTFHSYIRPNCLDFDPMNISVHGITPDMVEDEPSFSEVWPKIECYFNENTPIVAHNAPFDMSVLKQSLGHEPKEFFYIDSVRLATGYVDGSRSLKHCAEFFGIPLENHHHAGADAVACAMVVIEILKRSCCRTLWEHIAKNDRGRLIHRITELQAVETFGSRRPAQRKWKHYPSPSEICHSVDTVDPSCPLCGKKIVFTGELSIDRLTAMQIADDHGALVCSSVSKKTDFLVVGTQDKALVGEDGLSSKEEKAIEYNNTGKANIKIIREDEFMRLAGMEATV